MRKLLLIGGGHAHVYLLKRLRQQPLPNVEVTLLSSSAFQYYSGMLSGYIEGLYAKDEIRIDVRKLSEQAGVCFVEGSAVFVDPRQQSVKTNDGRTIYYDAVSFNIGSLTENDDFSGVADYACPIKPNFHFAHVMDKIQPNNRIVVVGGGASAIELGLAFQARREKEGNRTPVVLVSSGHPLEQAGKTVSRKIKKVINHKGMRIIAENKVTEVQRNHVITETGRAIPYDQLFWLTGPKAPKIFALSKLPVNSDGYLIVRNTLQVRDYPNMFGVGDCIGIEQKPSIPKAGVYPVRQAPVLWKNIQRFFAGKVLKRFRPQSSFLSILSTGNRQGFLMYRNFTAHGRWPWLLKRAIDKAFIHKYR